MAAHMSAKRFYMLETKPVTCSIASLGTAPSRRILAGLDVKSMTVEGLDGGRSPPSRTRSNLSPSRSATETAEFSASVPLVFADVAVMGVPRVETSRRGTGWSAMRSPTVSKPPETIDGTISDLRTTIVSRPGQKALASAIASGGTSSPYVKRSSTSPMSTGMGLESSLPFILKTRSTAFSSRALAATPYTVSVGMLMTPPRRRMSTARSIEVERMVRRSGCCTIPTVW